MDLISEMKRMLVSLTTPPYYYVVPARHGTASWRAESAIAYALYVSGLGATEEPKRLGATRVTLNKKASAIEDAVTRCLSKQTMTAITHPYFLNLARCLNQAGQSR